MCQFLQKSKQLSLHSAFITNPTAFKAMFSLACLAVQSSAPKGPQHSCCLQCLGQDLVTATSALTWPPPKKNFDLNIQLLLYQVLSDSCLSLRLQISVLCVDVPSISVHQTERCTLFFQQLRRKLCSSEGSSVFEHAASSMCISKLLLWAYVGMAQCAQAGEKPEPLPWGQLSCYLLTRLVDIPLAKQYLLNVLGRMTLEQWLRNKGRYTEKKLAHRKKARSPLQREGTSVLLPCPLSVPITCWLGLL